MARQLDYNAIIQIYGRFKDNIKCPSTELEYLNAYTLLVAVVLSAQATDVSVNLATKKLFKKVQRPDQMIKLGEKELTKYIKSIGLFRTKAKNIIHLTEILLKDHDGAIPSSRSALQSLPGVGRKTANVVLNIWFGLPTHPVDTHVFRVCNRTGIAIGKDILAIERILEDQIPADFQNYSHHWLILHGRYICKAKNPKCFDCYINDLCAYKEKRIA